MSTPSYSSFLRLPALLDLQRPTTTGELDPRVHAAEHFFIVAHQASELWLTQVLLDLERATAALGSPDTDLLSALEHLTRVVAVAELLTEHLAVLEKLPISCFARFRGALGNASGAQSAQFRALDRELGAQGTSSPVLTAYLNVVAAAGCSLAEIFREECGEPALLQIAETLLNIAQGLQRWKHRHLGLVTRLLGPDRPGTGGTEGAEHLVRRLELPFNELWAARSAVYELEKSA